MQVETRSIIASTKTRAFLDGQRCGSALQGPKLLRHHSGDTHTHRDQHIDLPPCKKRGIGRGNYEIWHNHHHISRSIAWTGHVVLDIVFKLDLAEANIQKVSIHTHFRTPVIPEKGNRDKEEKEKLK